MSINDPSKTRVQGFRNDKSNLGWAVAAVVAVFVIGAVWAMSGREQPVLTSGPPVTTTGQTAPTIPANPTPTPAGPDTTPNPQR